MDKKQSIEATLRHEGGYVNDPADVGGETNYGVTVATARSAGYTGDMRHLTRERAIEIYSDLYWDKVRGDELPPALAPLVFDMAVNMGVHRASAMLQRVLRALSVDATLSVDGVIGPLTIKAVGDYLEWRDDVDTLYRALDGLRVSHYVRLTETRPVNRRFVYGWLQR
ncbi:MAG: hypothetical protein GY767_22605 [Shimia sp.]|nr:hypothetical protein [Shimia sp.]